MCPLRETYQAIGHQVDAYDTAGLKANILNSLVADAI